MVDEIKQTHTALLSVNDSITECVYIKKPVLEFVWSAQCTWMHSLEHSLG